MQQVNSMLAPVLYTVWASDLGLDSWATISEEDRKTWREVARVATEFVTEERVIREEETHTGEGLKRMMEES